MERGRGSLCPSPHGPTSVFIPLYGVVFKMKKVTLLLKQMKNKACESPDLIQRCHCSSPSTAKQSGRQVADSGVQGPQAEVFSIWSLDLHKAPRSCHGQKQAGACAGGRRGPGSVPQAGDSLSGCRRPARLWGDTSPSGRPVRAPLLFRTASVTHGSELPLVSPHCPAIRHLPLVCQPRASRRPGAQRCSFHLETLEEGEGGVASRGDRAHLLSCQ